MVDKTFFGHMIQGEWILKGGELGPPVTVFAGLLRTWDGRAVWEYMTPDALEDNILAAEKMGAETMFVFGRPPASAIRPGSKNVPTADAWGQFVIAMVTNSAGRIKYWELWNEPEQGGYWDGSPSELVDQCKVAYQIIKELQPNSIVLSPSMTELGQSWGADFTDKFFAAGGGQWCDAIAFHHYSNLPEDFLLDFTILNGILKKYGVTKPSYNTEFNFANKDVSIRNAYIAQSLIIQASLGIVGTVYDPETELEANDYTDSTMAIVASWLIGATLSPLRIDGQWRRVVVSKSGQPDQELFWIDTSFPVLGSVTPAKKKNYLVPILIAAAIAVVLAFLLLR
jgi:hypothetical protein